MNLLRGRAGSLLHWALYRAEEEFSNQLNYLLFLVGAPPKYLNHLPISGKRFKIDSIRACESRCLGVVQKHRVRDLLSRDSETAGVTVFQTDN